MEEMRKHDEDNIDKPRLFRRPIEQDITPMESKEEYIRRQLSKLSVHDDDEAEDVEI